MRMYVHPRVLAEYDRFMQSKSERRRLWRHFMRLRRKGDSR